MRLRKSIRSACRFSGATSTSSSSVSEPLLSTILGNHLGSLAYKIAGGDSDVMPDHFQINLRAMHCCYAYRLIIRCEQHRFAPASTLPLEDVLIKTSRVTYHIAEQCLFVQSTACTKREFQTLRPSSLLRSPQHHYPKPPAGSQHPQNWLP